MFLININKSTTKESQPHMGQLTSKLNYKAFPVLPSLNPSLIFNLLPSSMHPIPDFPSVSSLSSLIFLSCCHRTTTKIMPDLDIYLSAIIVYEPYCVLPTNKYCIVGSIINNIVSVIQIYIYAYIIYMYIYILAQK